MPIAISAAAAARETIQASVAQDIDLGDRALVDPAQPQAAEVSRLKRAGGAKTAESKPAAAPTQPVTAAPLPSVEQSGMRSSIAP